MSSAVAAVGSMGAAAPAAQGKTQAASAIFILISRIGRNASPMSRHACGVVGHLPFYLVDRDARADERPKTQVNGRRMPADDDALLEYAAIGERINHPAVRHGALIENCYPSNERNQANNSAFAANIRHSLLAYRALFSATQRSQNYIGSGGQTAPCSRDMLRFLRASPLDPFLLLLIATVAAASLFPARGAAASAAGAAADAAIALLFFLHGAKLSREAIVRGMGNWRLHLMVLATTYLLFPAIGAAIWAFGPRLGDPLLLPGFLFLTLLPSTVQSSIAFTAMARGDVAAAVCSASLSNLIGIVATPLLATLLLGSGGVGPSGGAVQTIALQLLLPFVAGHLLRPWIGGFVARRKRLLQPVDRGSILLVVYAAFSAAVVEGIWSRVDVADLLAIVGLALVVLALVMGATMLAARAARLPRDEAVVLFFCGSKKSLVSGVPMAGALFAPAEVGIVILPLMIFHQLQLFLCAAMAARFRRAADAAEAAAIPQGEAAAEAAAARAGIAIPPACLPGVAANLALIGGHAALMRGGAAE